MPPLDSNPLHPAKSHYAAGTTRKDRIEVNSYYTMKVTSFDVLAGQPRWRWRRLRLRFGWAYSIHHKRGGDY